jgi:hypothetical protein
VCGDVKGEVGTSFSLGVGFDGDAEAGSFDGEDTGFVDVDMVRDLEAGVAVLVEEAGGGKEKENGAEVVVVVGAVLPFSNTDDGPSTAVGVISSTLSIFFTPASARFVLSLFTLPLPPTALTPTPRLKPLDTLLVTLGTANPAGLVFTFGLCLIRDFIVGVVGVGLAVAGFAGVVAGSLAVDVAGPPITVFIDVVAGMAGGSINPPPVIDRDEEGRGSLLG